MEIDSALGLAAKLAAAGRNAGRAAGKVNGAVADEIRDGVQSTLNQRGWGDTSEVRARRGSGGPHDPTAYVFLSGGAAWQEEGTSRVPPNPSLSPEVDRAVQGLTDRMADELEDWV